MVNHEIKKDLLFVLIERDELSNDEIYERAGVFAEFGKIVSISCGIVSDKINGKQIRMKSFASHDERKLLQEFANFVRFYINCLNFVGFII